MRGAESRRVEPARSLGWLGFACLLAAAWLAWPRPRVAPTELPRLACVLIDASAPVRKRAPVYAGHLSRLAAREARAAEAAGEDLALALFDRGARWWSIPRAADDLLARLTRGELPLGDPEASASSDLAAGLELVSPALLAPERPPGRLLVVGDGTATGRDTAELFDRLALRGVEVQFERLPEPSLPDARIHELRLPSNAEPGAPLAASLTWSLDSGADGAAHWQADSTLRLLCEFRDATGTRRFSRDLDWPTDSSTRRLSIELGAAREGALWLKAELEVRGSAALRNGDPLPENDAATATGRVGSTRVALVLAPAERVDLLRAWLGDSAPGIDWIVSASNAVESAPFEFDLLCTFDLTADELPHAKIEALLANGGGWFHAAGWEWLENPRSESARKCAAWLPISAAPLEGPAVERLFLVDGSGSMRGEPFESVRHALQQMLPLVADRDRIVLQLFSNALGPRVLLAPAGGAVDAGSFERLRAVQVPGGSTEILDCLAIIARSSLEPPTVRATVLLLSDGREDDVLRFAERAQRIRDDLKSTDRELSALAAGPDADFDFLAQLITANGRVVRAEDFDELTELFREAVGSERSVEGADAVANPMSPIAPDLARELAVAFDASIALDRAVRCAAREGAGVLLATANDAPILALAHAAGGRVAALATSPGPAWGGALSAADLAPLWRALARDHAPSGMVTAELEGDRLMLSGLAPGTSAAFDVELWRESAAQRDFETASRALVGGLEVAEPVAASGRDRSAVRTAQLPRGLPLTGGAGELVLRAAQPPLVIPLAGSPGTAFLPSARRGYSAVRSSRALGGPPPIGLAAHPASFWVLAAGLSALFGSALWSLLGAASKPR